MLYSTGSKVRNLDWRNDSKAVVVQIFGLGFDCQNPWEKPGVITVLIIPDLSV